MTFWTHTLYGFSHMFCYCRMWYEKKKTPDQVITGGVMPSYLSHLSYYYHFLSKIDVFALIQAQNTSTPKIKPFCGEHKWHDFFCSKIWQSKWLHFIVLSIILQFFSCYMIISLQKTRIQRSVSEKCQAECLISESKCGALFLILMKLTLEVQR